MPGRQLARRVLIWLGRILRPRNRFLARSSPNARHHLHHRRRGDPGPLRPLRCRAAAGLTAMLVQLIYAAGALFIGGYMVAALLRPDKF
jgi:hypothetical protein